MKIISVDIETGGLDPFSDALLSLGIVPLNATTLEPEGPTFYAQRKPGVMELVHSEALAVNRLDPTKGMEPGEFRDAVRAYLVGLDDTVLFPLGHNGAGFDGPFLKQRLAETWTSYVHYRWRDTMVLANAMVDAGIITNGHHRGLKSLCNRYNIPYGNHHALGDAHCTAQLYAAMLAELRS